MAEPTIDTVNKRLRKLHLIGSVHKRTNRFTATLGLDFYYLTQTTFRLAALLAFHGDWVHKRVLFPNLVDGYLCSRYIYRLKLEIPVKVSNDHRGNYLLVNPVKIHRRNLKLFPDYQVSRMAGAGVVEI